LIESLLSCGGIRERLRRWRENDLLAILALSLRLRVFNLLDLLLMIVVFFIDVIEELLKSVSVVGLPNTEEPLLFHVQLHTLNYEINTYLPLEPLFLIRLIPFIVIE